MKPRDKGVLVVISGPSGVGKGTLVNAVLRRDRQTRFSVSATTRPPRPGEIDGVSYYFLSREEFELRRARREFLEWAENFGNYYGTLNSEVNRLLDEGCNVILDIDTQGAEQVRRLRPQAVFIFIMPPSVSELRRRITRRGTESAENLRLRLQRAEAEMAKSVDYDHVVINESVDEAAAQILSIISASRAQGGDQA